MLNQCGSHIRRRRTLVQRGTSDRWGNSTERGPWSTASTRRWPNVGLMVGRRQRRRHTINPTSGPVTAEWPVACYHCWEWDVIGSRCGSSLVSLASLSSWPFIWSLSSGLINSRLWPTPPVGLPKSVTFCQNILQPPATYNKNHRPYIPRHRLRSRSLGRQHSRWYADQADLNNLPSTVSSFCKKLRDKSSEAPFSQTNMSLGLRLWHVRNCFVNRFRDLDQ